MNRTATRHSLRQKSNGFILISLIALLAMGGTYLFLTFFTPEAIVARRQKVTEDALVQARDALMGYALRYREDQIDDKQYDRVYGYLPLPDLGSLQNNNVACTQEGCDAANNTTNFTVIGRFPWRALGTIPLRDGNGECLWMAISGSHDRIQRPSPMNWDTPAQIDVVIADKSATLVSALTDKHDRPVAVIFSPGPILTGQNRGPINNDDVTECGGNYDVNNYLDPATTPPFSATNHARGSTATQPKQMSIQGAIHAKSDGTFWQNNCPVDSPCDNIIANNIGIPLSGDYLFGELRKSNLYRTDIDAMLARIASCLSKAGVSASAFPIATDTCYDDSNDPLGYFSHYQNQIFVAKCTGNCSATIDGVVQSDCPSVLIFAGQRSANQSRLPTALSNSGTDERINPDNYLEEPNLTSFKTGGTIYSGAGKFSRESSWYPKNQDILRCIPSTTSFTAAPSALAAGSELSSYDAATQTITLGRFHVESDRGYAAADLFGCIWSRDANTTGSGFRVYFKFQITNTGDGFTFAAIDGDRNGSNVCGAARQHLGYSGNNLFTPIINYPKLGIEFDTNRNFNATTVFLPDGFKPDVTSAGFTFNTLNNGRADPNYTGHIGLVYWGGESLISTSNGTSNACSPTLACRFPAVCDAGFCKLKQEEDDNVHGQLPTAPSTRPPPLNPAAPVSAPVNPPPPYPPNAVYRLGSTALPIHVRVEVTRSKHVWRDDNSHLAKLVTTTNLTALSGLPTIDGVTVQAGDTILVTAQTSPKENGLYVAAADTWTRAGSANESSELPPGTSWFVNSGVSQKGSLWRLQNLEAPIMGIGDITLQKYRAPITAVATSNITPSGLQMVDGIALATGDRVLLTAQTVASENGVYMASISAWGRSSPESTSSGMRDGSVWYVTGGTETGFWRLNGDVTPGATNASIARITPNDIHSSVLTTEVWKEGASTTPVRMPITTRAMAQLAPVVRYGQCSTTSPCPSSNPADQVCGGTEVDGLRYCYTGDKPTLYDSKTIYDIRGSACDSGLNCSEDKQYCGIDSYCYQTAFRSTRLGFTGSQGTLDQEIEINADNPVWLP